jgi:hypothetical protein
MCELKTDCDGVLGNKKDDLTVIYTPGSNLKVFYFSLCSSACECSVKGKAHGTDGQKTGDMAVGQVSFHNDKRVKRGTAHPSYRFLLTIPDPHLKALMLTFPSTLPWISHSDILMNVGVTVHVPKRENVIVNRLNKTKVVREVDHEQERVDRIKRENAVKRAAAMQLRKEEQEQAKAREAQKKAWSYDSMFDGTPVEDEDEEVVKEEKKYGSIREMEDDFM